jgi:hypothetical protein
MKPRSPSSPRSADSASSSTIRSDAVTGKRAIDLLSDSDGVVSMLADGQNIADATSGNAAGGAPDLNVVAAYKAHFREDPFAFVQQVWAYGQGEGWRGCVPLQRFGLCGSLTCGALILQVH